MTSSSNLIHGIDISKMLQSKGPVVKCVLLKAVEQGSVASDAKQPATGQATEGDGQQRGEAEERHVLVDAIEEVEIDTTPQKQMVAQVLGGNFTFVGQYEDEGIMLMVRNVEDLDESLLPPINRHLLQPPFDEHEIRGDILILKVAATEETLDDVDANGKEVVVPTNDDVFLNYTKAEYVAFAKRTDVVAPEALEGDDADSEDGGEDEDEEDDEDYNAEDDDDDDDEHTGMMNLLLSAILRKFTEDNGRGPNTDELLQIREALASKLGIQLATVPSADEPAKKRKSDACSPLAKRVKFGDDVVLSVSAENADADNDGANEDLENEDGQDGKVGG